jgi:hypothetical protein
MIKKILIIGITNIVLIAQPSSYSLEKKCINCHKKQKIPSELIYRRYLMRYSDKQTIQKKIFEYLKNPKEKNSIMPKQFFLKFPMKKRVDLNNTILKKEIDRYMDAFDVKKRLILLP